MTTLRKRGKPVGFRKSGGRKAGTPNKATRNFREAVNEVLRANADNIAVWLKVVAEGDPVGGMRPDPARALDVIAKLAEYCVPKMSRHDAEQEASAQGVTTIEIEFVDAPQRDTVVVEMPESKDPIEDDFLPLGRVSPGKKHS